MDGEEHVCPVCRQPVVAVVRRHKTLGAWVPVWVPGPCRNPECRASDTAARESDTAAARRPQEPPAEADGPAQADGPAAHPGPMEREEEGGPTEEEA
ncbi:hypothetical protein ABZ484_17540 [Streptomyces sp. NPDC006393]|uniref:hypothetical protein n=1 Tax=Streptomyces sp. NPDC006393 TaxID=3156763 RepID=UPI0033E25FE0